MKIYILMLNDACLGAYSSEVAAENAQRADNEKWEKYRVSCGGGQALYYRIGTWELDAPATF